MRVIIHNGTEASGLLVGSGVSTMAAEGSPSFFRLNAVDRLGRKIDPQVLAAAEEVFPRAVEHGLKLLGDPAVVTNTLEEVAATVSRVLRANGSQGNRIQIRNLPGYVFRSFVRQVNRLKRSELAMAGFDGIGPRSAPAWADPSRQLELKILADECLRRCDFVARDMFRRRAQGFSWEEIGKIHGISAHTAEVRFRQALQKVRSGLKIASRNPGNSK